MKVKFYDNEECETYSSSGKILARFKTIYEPVFNSQYGTPLSLDNNLIFIGEWYRGLFCYSTHSGELVWEQRPGKVRQILVFKDSIIVEMGNRGIFKRNIKNGKLIKILKMSAIEFLYCVGDDLIFTGPKNNKYFLIKVPELKILKSIKRSEIDPDNHLSLSIRNCKISGNSMIITCYKQYSNEVYNQKSKSTQSKVIITI